MKKKIDTVTNNKEYKFYRKLHKLISCWYCGGTCSGWSNTWREKKNWKNYRNTQYYERHDE